MPHDQSHQNFLVALERSRLGQTALAKLVGTSKQQIDKLKRGQTISRHWAERLSPFLDVSVQFLMGLEDTIARPAKERVAPPPSIRIARFRAARWACWGEDFGKARQRLRLAGDDLERVESGDLDLDPDLVIRFAGVTGIPLVWFDEGSLEGTPGPIAARIGLYDPDLVPDPVMQADQSSRPQATVREVAS